MAQVIWAESALTSLKEITDYVAQTSPARADELAARFDSAPDILEHSPRAGRRVPEFDREDIRELVTVRPYRLLYVVREEVCHIMAIIHSKRDLAALLRPEDLTDID